MRTLWFFQTYAMQFKTLEIIKCMCMYVTIRVKQYYFKLKEKTQITERYLNDITDIVIMLCLYHFMLLGRKKGKVRK